MGFINRLLQLVLFISIISIVILTTFVGVFSSNQKLTAALEKSGFYQTAANTIAGGLKDQVTTDNPLLTELIKNSITKTVNSDLAKSVVQPSQIVFVQWLNSNDKNLEVNLDLLNLKNKIIATSSNSQVKFEITKLLPDNYELMNTKKSKGGFISQAQQVRAVYSLTKRNLPYIWLIAGVSALLIFAINLRSGSKKFSRVAYPFILASGFGLVLALLSKYSSDVIISSVSSLTGQNDTVPLILRILITILQETLNVFIAIGIVSVIALFVSKLLYRSKDKALKKKG